MPSKYPIEFRQRAVRLLQETVPQSESEYAAIRHVASRLGISTETLRRWYLAVQVDAGERVGTTTSEREEIRRLKRENAELRRANEILKTASAFFAAELDRPTTRSTVGASQGVLSAPLPARLPRLESSAFAWTGRSRTRSAAVPERRVKVWPNALPT